MSILFGILFMYLTITWKRFYNNKNKIPKSRTAVGFILLTITAMATTTPSTIAAFGLVSLGFHMNKHLWNPFHGGILFGFGIGLILLTILTVIGFPPSMIKEDGPAIAGLFLITGISASVGTVFSTAAGPPWRYHSASINILGGLRYTLKKRFNNGDNNGKTDPNNHSDNEDSDTQNTRSNGYKNDSTDIESTQEQSQDDLKTDQKDDTMSKSNNQQDQKNRHDTINHSEIEDDVKEPQKNQSAGAEDNQNDEIDFKFPWEEPPDMRFEDIGGYREIKEELREKVVTPIRTEKESFKRFNIEPSRGLLFHGPPGTGKTMFARALANSLNKPFVELTQADLTHEHINKPPQIIQNLFNEAEQLEGVIFIDEAEQLLSDRSNNHAVHTEDQKVTNTFLSNLTKENQNYIVLLTTNFMDNMDDAILRPGRVDKKFKIDLPDKEARLEILKVKLAKVPNDLREQDLHPLVTHTEGWSGADLNALFEHAKFSAAKRDASHLTMQDLKVGYNEVREDIEGST